MKIRSKTTRSKTTKRYSRFKKIVKQKKYTRKQKGGDELYIGDIVGINKCPNNVVAKITNINEKDNKIYGINFYQKIKDAENTYKFMQSSTINGNINKLVKCTKEPLPLLIELTNEERRAKNEENAAKATAAAERSAAAKAAAEAAAAKAAAERAAAEAAAAKAAEERAAAEASRKYNEEFIGTPEQREKAQMMRIENERNKRKYHIGDKFQLKKEPTQYYYQGYNIPKIIKITDFYYKLDDGTIVVPQVFSHKDVNINIGREYTIRKSGHGGSHYITAKIADYAYMADNGLKYTEADLEEKYNKLP